ncbi:MAG TPA: DUF5666 domain-containing protein [Ktedonobacterales bacterium]
MQSSAVLLRSKIGIAVLGIVILGGVGAYLGASSAWHPSAGPRNGGIANTGTGAGTATAAGPNSAATSSPTDGSGTQTGNPSPTNIPGGPQPTNPPVGTGQTVDLHGTIGTINTDANTFMLNGSTKVIVNGQTSFQGSATSFQGLRSGWSAEVKGQWQGDGTFLAFLVNSDNGN